VPARVDLDAWRVCDAVGAVLLDEAGVDDGTLVDLYLHGDLEERIIVLRALGLRPVTDGTVRLLEEAQRTNMESHFKAAACDSNLPLRATAHAEFGSEGFRRMILKAAFLGLPEERLLDVDQGADEELSRMLQDLATEREAAGRAIWPGTSLLIAHAPTAGSVARVVGGLEHGDDRLRHAAARGLLRLNRRDLEPFAAERLPREPRQAIRELLERAIRPD
ncbi:MAG: EboA domain-containing protein, partial [Planctomycetota bacterium JB042]